MIVKEPKASWGGAWTERKLNAFSKYVKSYLMIMKKHPYWKTIYFDGFAGSGKRATSKSKLYAQLSISPEEEKIYQGSAERVLSLEAGLAFDYYYFIDTTRKHLTPCRNILPRRP
jgi:three-Cys-motif partner protein